MPPKNNHLINNLMLCRLNHSFHSCIMLTLSMFPLFVHQVCQRYHVSVFKGIFVESHSCFVKLTLWVEDHGRTCKPKTSDNSDTRLNISWCSFNAAVMFFYKQSHGLAHKGCFYLTKYYFGGSSYKYHGVVCPLIVIQYATCYIKVSHRIKRIPFKEPLKQLGTGSRTHNPVFWM